MNDDRIISPYPLCWPNGVARTPPNKRHGSPFRTDFETAVRNVTRSLVLFAKDSGVKIEHVILSTNVDLLNRNPPDPGAAAWFKFDGAFVAFGVDRFTEVKANVQAIHHIVEARRVELRYGGLAIVRQTFRSFVALPAPMGWREILGLDGRPSRDEINRAYRSMAAKHHPDLGGSQAKMAEINRARDEAFAEIGQ